MENKPIYTVIYETTGDYPQYYICYVGTDVDIALNAFNDNLQEENDSWSVRIWNGEKQTHQYTKRYFYNNTTGKWELGCRIISTPMWTESKLNKDSENIEEFGRGVLELEGKKI